MKYAARCALLTFLLTLAHVHEVQSQTGYAAPIMAGISGRAENQRQPYVTAGDRAYLIGTQDGDFPDMGGHVPDEMGGLWLHPIKLIDGFWATVADTTTHREVALSKCSEFITYPYGNRFKYRRVLDSLEVERVQFSPDGQPGVIVQYSFTNTSARRRDLQVQLSVKTDLLPVWYSEHLGIEDHADTVAWQAAERVFVARDASNPWFCVWGASSPATPLNHSPSIHANAPGATAAARYSVSVEPHGTATLTFVFAGSDTTRKAALDAYQHLARAAPSLLETKKQHYAAIIDRARIRIPDKRLEEVYNWVRVNTEWMVRDVPGIGRGVGGGMMEYPWWFGTETYTLQALTAAGEFTLVQQDLRLLESRSMKANGNGRIVHEVTTNGAVSNPGNTQETAQFILTVRMLIDWSGDLAFAREMYPAMKRGLTWLLTDMDRNHDLFPEGYGIMEVYGLNAELIDVAVYTQQALAATAKLAAVLGEPANAARYDSLASELRTRINDRFWVDADSSYADFYGTRAQAIAAADGAIKQIRFKGENNLTREDRERIGYYERLKQRFATLPDTSRGWLTNKNWVITTPMEIGIAPRARALRLLDRIRNDVGAYGPYLSATERNAMMTISTGVQAVSEGNYGRIDRALWYVDKIVQTFNRVTPGSISEMMPDYGCFTIAWTSYGIVIPLIQQMFGIHPDALHKTVVLDPQIPSGWNDLSLENLRIGTSVISFSRVRTEKGVEYDIASSEAGWTFVLKGSDAAGAKCYVNGAPAAVTAEGLRLSGRKNHVLLVR